MAIVTQEDRQMGRRWHIAYLTGRNYEEPLTFHGRRIITRELSRQIATEAFEKFCREENIEMPKRMHITAICLSSGTMRQTDYRLY